MRSARSAAIFTASLTASEVKVAPLTVSTDDTEVVYIPLNLARRSLSVSTGAPILGVSEWEMTFTPAILEPEEIPTIRDISPPIPPFQYSHI